MAASSVGSIKKHFRKLTDPRVVGRTDHLLVDILVMAICAVIANCNGWRDIALFAKKRATWFKRFLRLANGIPSHYTFRRVFDQLNPRAFQSCLVAWIKEVSDLVGLKHIAIDGKTLRHSGNDGAGLRMLHAVSAWATEQHLLLGQVMTEEKSNEITAIPKLLQLLDLHGALVTIDAMGCQKEIAAKVRERGADYVLTVKGNQEHLEEDIMTYFAALDEGTKHNRRRSRTTLHTQGHGRVETRWYDAVPVPRALRHRDEWKDLRSICRVTRAWTERGEEKSEVRYFISSLAADTKVLAKAILGHWGIENGLHWVLDMYFAEDRSRARTEHAAANLAVLRRWIVTLLRQDKTLKDGIEKKRLQAGWNETILERILGLS